MGSTWCGPHHRFIGSCAIATFIKIYIIGKNRDAFLNRLAALNYGDTLFLTIQWGLS